MTLAIGLIAMDGTVIAADGQLTLGEASVQHGKVRAQNISGKVTGSGVSGASVVSGAGIPDAYLFRCSEIFQRAFASNPLLVGEELREVLEGELRTFNLLNVVPFAAVPDHDRPGVDMLFAYERGDQSGLWRSDDSVMVDSRPYAAVGTGAPNAYGTLTRMYRLPAVDVWQTVLLAAYVMYVAKESNIFVGKGTDVCIVAENQFMYLSRKFTKRLDRAMEEYSQSVEAATFRFAAGAQEESPDLTDMRATFTSLLSDMSSECQIPGLKKYGNQSPISSSESIG